MSKFSAFIAVLLLCVATTLRAQVYNPDIDVEGYIYRLKLNDADNTIQGQALIHLSFRKDASSFWLDLTQKNKDGKGMTVSSIKDATGNIAFIQENDRLILQSRGQAGTTHSYIIEYEGVPADGLIISNNKYGHRGFFGDNWPNRAHNWLPCVDHPSDKATLEFFITAPDHYKVVANGALVEEQGLPERNKMTHWKESVPLSPKVMVIGVADFAIDHPGDAQGIPVWNWVYPENKEQGFHDYAFALQILPFYISHIGPYPFEKCGNVQSKTRFGGLENASAIFYFEGSVGSPGVESLMAHEIAHQWFGDDATETEWHHLWLSEGFATYMTHCYLENKYGADTLKKGMSADRKQAIQYEKTRKTCVVDTTIQKDYMQLLNPNSYQKGGWVLHMLRRRIGDDLFWKGISKYYMTYRHLNASTTDFEKVMEAVSGKDLSLFFRQWLFTPGHPHVSARGQYDADRHEFTINFTQTQEGLFSFPLEYAVDGVMQKVEIREKTTTVRLALPAKPDRLVMDPSVNLLADYEVTMQ